VNVADLKPPPQSHPHNFLPLDLASDDDEDISFNHDFSNLHVHEPTPPPDGDANMSLMLDVESEEMGAISDLWDMHAEVEPPPPFNMGFVFHYNVPPVNEGDGEGEEMDQGGNRVDSSVSRSSGSEASYTPSDDAGSLPPLEEGPIDVDFDLLTSLSRLGRVECTSSIFFTSHSLILYVSLVFGFSNPCMWVDAYDNVDSIYPRTYVDAACLNWHLLLQYTAIWETSPIIFVDLNFAQIYDPALQRYKSTEEEREAFQKIYGEFRHP
jgi:hypothetical protein